MSEQAEQPKSPLMSLAAIRQTAVTQRELLRVSIEGAGKDALKQAAVAWTSIATTLAIFLPELVAQQSELNRRQTLAEERTAQAEAFVANLETNLKASGVLSESGILIPQAVVQRGRR